MTTSGKLESAFFVTITGLTIPIMILNLLGGVISGIWLAILGEWSEIFRGILFFFISGFAISFALMPSLLFAAPAAMAIERGKRIIGVLFGSISVFYTVGLMTMWCLWVLWLFTGSATESSLVPLLIWSYGVALGPWMWLASKDQQGGGNEFSMMTTFFAQVAYMLAMIMFFLGATLGIINITFGAIMAIGALIQISIAFVMARQEQQLYQSHESAFDGVEELNSPPEREGEKTTYCGECGKQLDANSKFCAHCGFKVQI